MSASREFQLSDFFNTEEDEIEAEDLDWVTPEVSGQDDDEETFTFNCMTSCRLHPATNRLNFLPHMLSG